MLLLLFSVGLFRLSFAYSSFYCSLHAPQTEEETRLQQTRAAAQRSSDRALKGVLFMWGIIIIGIFLHIASVVQQGIATRNREPVPEHYLRVIFGPVLSVGAVVQGRFHRAFGTLGELARAVPLPEIIRTALF